MGCGASSSKKRDEKGGNNNAANGKNNSATVRPMNAVVPGTPMGVKGKSAPKDGNKNIARVSPTRSLPNLSTLKLCWADTLQDRRRSRKIKAISEDAMACLAAPNAYTLTSITSLSLGAGSGLTTSSLATCLTAFTQLKKLKLNEAYTTTDDAFENFQEGKGIVFLKIPGDVRGYLVRIDVLTEKFLRTSFFSS